MCLFIYIELSFSLKNIFPEFTKLNDEVKYSNLYSSGFRLRKLQPFCKLFSHSKFCGLRPNPQKPQNLVPLRYG